MANFTLHGLVVKSTGSWQTVLTDAGQTIACKVKGNLRLRGLRTTNPVAVGDRVTIVQREGDEVAFISEIGDRRNAIIRRSPNLSKQSHILAANIDQAALLFTIARPETTTTFADRFLAGAEAYGVPAIIVFNKIDDLRSEEFKAMETLETIYKDAGYPCYRISALNGSGTQELLSQLEGKLTLLSGHSGSGKTTLLNTLIPEAKARTAPISEVHGQGMHTTTYSILYSLPSGGALIDIPGIKGFGTFDFKQAEVGHYFRDIFALSHGCRYGGCTHTHEPGCAVRQALDNHQLAPSRYVSYLSMLEDESEGKYRKDKWV
ncbi:MAG: ribosome small subunit-dependent GTPase A [Bacteroidaceae bacterium]|nr:ribosome small subunit-dependent GTPase A [Bacteroidaceae bacterium]